MTPERWQKIENLVLSALELAPNERVAFLSKECAGDSALRGEVESLLSLQVEAENFIKAPAVAFASGLLQEEKGNGINGKRIGPYRVLRELGHGGMGAVYLAQRDDDQYQKLVAIKLLQRSFDTEEMRGHFRHERQILASLDHTNIARLLDGGTTQDGSPYIVMEYVEGVSLNRYCDENKLSTSERLKLFRAVCDAVSYAHRNLVIHRDIKPGNILVTKDGLPKLLDFGIAKLIDPEHLSEQTVTAIRAMTPDYASPEQVRGQPMTTASDVYSLGVVLYELLCGHRPYQIKSRAPEEIVHAICETEPDKPSTAIKRIETLPAGRITITPESVSLTREGSFERLRRKLRGDLDNIVMKALKKEPWRRYTSVEQFSEDIRRHVEGLPVLARPDTFGYRSMKFIKRHSVGIAATILIFLSLSIGIIATITQARRAERQRERAEKRFNDVRKLANTFLFEINPAIEKLPGSTPARQLVVKHALEYLDSLAQESSNDQSLQKELANAYEKVGDVQGYPSQPNLGDLNGALSSYKKARAIREAFLSVDGGNLDTRDALAENYEHTALTIWYLSDTKEALENYKRAIVLRETLIIEFPHDIKQKRKLANLQMLYGDVPQWNGNTEEALQHYRKAYTILESLRSSHSKDEMVLLDIGRCHVKIGNALSWADDLKGAMQEFDKAFSILEPLVASHPNDVSLKRALWLAYTQAGETLEDTDVSLAFENYQKMMHLAEEMARSDALNTQARYDLGLSYKRMGDIAAKRKRFEEAMQNYKKAIEIQEYLIAIDPNNTSYRGSLANNYNLMGNVRMLVGDLEGALESQKKALHLREDLVAGDSSDTSAQRDIALSWQSIGNIQLKLAQTVLLNRMDQWHKARESFQRSLDIFLKLQSQNALREYDQKEMTALRENLNKCDEALAKK